MEAKAMKKIFIFLFSVFLITFMGCSPATGEIPETPISETIFALDDADNILLDENGIEIGIKKINDKFNYTEDNFQEYIQPYFYKRLKINDAVYTVKSLNINNIQICVYEDYEYYFANKKANPLDFLDFIDPQKNAPISFEDGTTIFFSDLYEVVNIW